MRSGFDLPSCLEKRSLKMVDDNYGRTPEHAHLVGAEPLIVTKTPRYSGKAAHLKSKLCLRMP